MLSERPTEQTRTTAAELVGQVNSIPGGRTFLALRLYAAREVKVCHHIPETWWNQIHVHRASQVQNFEAPMTAVSDLSGLKKQQRGKR